MAVHELPAGKQRAAKLARSEEERTYLQLAPASRLSFQDLDAVAKFWWTRPFPRGLLTAAARAIRLARGEIVEGLPHPRDRLFLPHPDRRRPQIIEDRPSSKGGMRRRVAS